MTTWVFFSLRRKNKLSRYMQVFSYLTIRFPSEGIYKEKGSKFLAFAYPVEDENAVKRTLDTLRKQYFDARHHCFAYVLGPEKSRYRAFDDGEPNHSAGDPILGQVRSMDLTDVLVVVIRYFGGIKLGVGGLINAYKAAAQDALSHARVIEKEVLRHFTLCYEYSSTPVVMRLVKDFDLTIIGQSFREQCLLRAAFKLKNEVKLFEKIRLLQATGIRIEITTTDQN